MKTGNIL